MNRVSIHINGHNIHVVLEKDAEGLFPCMKEILSSLSFLEDIKPDAVLHITTAGNQGAVKKNNSDVMTQKRIVVGGKLVTALDLSSGKITGTYFIKMEWMPSREKGALRSALLEAINVFTRECFFFTDTLIFHAASIEKCGKGYLFLGPSGSGKTTICQLSGACRVMHDELSVLRRNCSGYLIYPGYAQGDIMVSYEGVPLRAVFFIQQANFNSAEKMPLKDSFVMGLAQCQNYLFDKEDRFFRIHNNLIDFLKEAEIFRLRFKKDSSFWDCIAEHVN